MQQTSSYRRHVPGSACVLHRGQTRSKEIGLLQITSGLHAPWHVRVEISDIHRSSGFICPTGGTGYTAAMKVMEAVYRNPVRENGGGGSIPLMNVLKHAVPEAEFILWGCEDNERSRIHGPNESVAIDELERMIVTQTLLLQALGNGFPIHNQSVT